MPHTSHPNVRTRRRYRAHRRRHLQWGSNTDPRDPNRPGPIYVRAVRVLVETDTIAFCRLLGIHLNHQPEPELLTQTFTGITRTVDLLLRIGPNHLLHVEYQTRAGPGLAARMLEYRALIIRHFPGHRLDQRVVILGDGHLDDLDDPDNPTGFRLGCQPLYLRDLPPDDLLTSPTLAPLAVLAAGTPTTRIRALGAALTLITTTGGPHTHDLLTAAAVLATIRLDRATVAKIRQETGMTVENLADFYADTDFGRELRTRGLEQGLEQGHQQTLTHLLRARFPNPHDPTDADLTAIAHQLAHEPDLTATCTRILAAHHLDDLRHP